MPHLFPVFFDPIVSLREIVPSANTRVNGSPFRLRHVRLFDHERMFVVTDADAFAEIQLANHYDFVYEDIGNRLAEFCALTGRKDVT